MPKFTIRTEMIMKENVGQEVGCGEHNGDAIQLQAQEVVGEVSDLNWGWWCLINRP